MNKFSTQFVYIALNLFHLQSIYSDNTLTETNVLFSLKKLFIVQFTEKNSCFFYIKFICVFFLFQELS